MANPFIFYKSPANARETQSNANWSTYERMGAAAELAEFDAAGIRAPFEVIADAHTTKWVERELIREARKAREPDR